MSLLNRDQIRSLQSEACQRLIETTLGSNPFYHQLWTDAGVDIDQLRHADFPGGLLQLPFTEKFQLVENQKLHPPYGTNLAYPVARYSRLNQTSGSTTGNPIRWLDTPESWNWMLDNWIEVYRSAGVTSEDRIYFAFSFGPFLGFWTAFEAASKMGAMCIPGGGLNSSARLKMIFDNQVTTLCCTPTYALRLAEVAEQEGWELNKAPVQTLIVAGEPGASIPSTRARIQRLWPTVKIVDHHGMTEVGPVTYECPRRVGSLHVIESGYYTEIINPKTLKPTEPGKMGELVLTTLGRVGSPLIRYRTGDWVRKSANTGFVCDCGRSEILLEGGILGRVDDMVIIRGVNVFPGAVEEALRRAPGLAEYRATITETDSLTDLKIEIEPLPEADPQKLRQDVHREIQTMFALRPTIQLVEPNSLPRFEMKAKRWFKQSANSHSH